MGSDTSTASVLVLLFVICTGMPIVASSSPVTDSNRTNSAAAQQGERTTSNQTVAVVITFQNHTAREAASFNDTVTVTGGKDVQFMPVLFARTTASTIPEIESNPKVETVQIDKQIAGPTPEATASADTRKVHTATTGQTVPWGVRRIGTERVSDRLRNEGAENVTVAVVDSGVDYTHPDLDDAVVWGVNFTGTDTQYGRETATDNHGHGTAVAGIIAAEDNERGVVGIAPGTRLYSIKVLDQDNTGSISSLIKGMNAAIEGPDGTIGTDDDADVLQMSVGTEAMSDQLAAASAAAGESAVVVNSVGNEGDGDPATSEVTFPAAYEETLAVAATDTSNETTVYSAEGSAVDVAAPGEQIETLNSGGGTTTFYGTSAATPHVSGMIVLLLAADEDSPDKNLTVNELRSLVSRTAADIENPGADRYSGRGLVQVDTAVAEVLSTTIERTSTESTVTGGETVTLTRTTYATGSNLTAADSFVPSMATTEIQTITLNGKETKPVDQSANESGVAVSLRGLNIGDKISVTYTVKLLSNSRNIEEYRIQNVGSSETKEAITLRAKSQASVPRNVSTYDRDNNGKISFDELSIVALDYGNNKVSFSIFSKVVLAYSKSRDS